MKKKLKSLIRFHSANKIDNYNRGREEKKKKKSKRMYRTSQNIRITNVFLESLLSESFPLLGVTVHLTSLGCPPRMLISGPTPICSCLQCPQLSELVCSLLWELSMTFYIFHRHTLPSWSCGFNLQLVQLVGRFWFFFLSHTAPGFQLWFYFHLCMWVVHWGFSWGCPEGLGSAPVKARCGGSTAAWVAGILAAPGTQGCW